METNEHSCGRANALYEVDEEVSGHKTAVFPGKTKRIHWSFDDPAEATGNEEEVQAVFRRVRDEIRERLNEFVKMI